MEGNGRSGFELLNPLNWLNRRGSEESFEAINGIENSAELTPGEAVEMLAGRIDYYVIEVREEDPQNLAQARQARMMLAAGLVEAELSGDISSDEADIISNKYKIDDLINEYAAVVFDERRAATNGQAFEAPDQWAGTRETFKSLTGAETLYVETAIKESAADDEAPNEGFEAELGQAESTEYELGRVGLADAVQVEYGTNEQDITEVGYEAEPEVLDAYIEASESPDAWSEALKELEEAVLEDEPVRERQDAILAEYEAELGGVPGFEQLRGEEATIRDMEIQFADESAETGEVETAAADEAAAEETSDDDEFSLAA